MFWLSIEKDTKTSRLNVLLFSSIINFAEKPVYCVHVLSIANLNICNYMNGFCFVCIYLITVRYDGNIETNTLTIIKIRIPLFAIKPIAI